MAADLEAERQAREQRLLFANYELTRVGTGPGATGAQSGWSLSSQYFFRCRRCDYYMNLAMKPDTESCPCGALHKDLGRFSSSLGDDSVDVYVARHRMTGAYFEASG